MLDIIKYLKVESVQTFKQWNFKFKTTSEIHNNIKSKILDDYAQQKIVISTI